MGPPTLKLELKDGMVVWDWGYRNLFLCEYYLLTGDKEVLHAIKEYTLSLAKGQSMYGTFGHGISDAHPRRPAPRIDPALRPGERGGTGRQPGDRHGQEVRREGSGDRSRHRAGLQVLRLLSWTRERSPTANTCRGPITRTTARTPWPRVLFALQGNRNAAGAVLCEDVHRGLREPRIRAYRPGIQLPVGRAGRQCRRTGRGGGLLQGSLLAPRPRAALRWLVHL